MRGGRSRGGTAGRTAAAFRCSHPHQSAHASVCSPRGSKGEPLYKQRPDLRGKVSRQSVERNIVGVPYVMHVDDLRCVAPKWLDYSIAVRE